VSRRFKDFMREVEEEALREGPQAVAELKAFDAHFRLAAELILLRRQRGLTQRQLSTKSGVQQAEISRIEGGRANPTVSTLSALASALGGELGIRILANRRGQRKARAGRGPARRRPVAWRTTAAVTRRRRS
jgi:DNA-binding XRE family transcriptional regulator